jgi:hypothetical protein
MQIKQLRFDSVNADFSVANAFVELLRTKNGMKRQSMFRLARRTRRGVMKNMDEPSILQRNGETAFAISPNVASKV